MGRAPCCEKVGLRRGRWTAEEDEKLLNYIAAHGEGSWRSLPRNAGLLRCGKSCRLRWINYLRADLKRGDITPQEEQVIIKLHSALGNRWSVIAGHLPGRTDNEIKNYWNSHLSRRVHRFRKVGSENEIVTMVLDKVPGGGRRRGGRRSRSAMKKNSIPTSTANHSINTKAKQHGIGPSISNSISEPDPNSDTVFPLGPSPDAATDPGGVLTTSPVSLAVDSEVWWDPEDLLASVEEAEPTAGPQQKKVGPTSSCSTATSSSSSSLTGKPPPDGDLDGELWTWLMDTNEMEESWRFDEQVQGFLEEEDYSGQVEYMSSWLLSDRDVSL